MISADDRGFLGHRQIGRAGGGDDDRAASRGELAERERDGSGQLVKHCLGDLRRDGVEGVAGRCA